MHRIEQTIDVSVPVATAYAQWTQFEEFPRFMDNVESVEQHDERRLRWSARIAGSERDWSSEITEQVPEKRIAWKSTAGADHAGVVTFHRLDDDHARVTLQMDYRPEGLVENVADLLGVVDRAVKRDLDNFKRFIESRGVATGAYRGRIPAPHER